MYLRGANLGNQNFFQENQKYGNMTDHMVLQSIFVAFVLKDHRIRTRALLVKSIK